MDPKDDEPPPFWVQSTTTLHQVDRHRRRHRHASSLFLNTGSLVLFLLAAALVFMIIVVPYIVSHARQVFNPSLVKTGWSSLNIVLVVFAILCGFLSRKDDEPVTPVDVTNSRKDEFKAEHESSQYYGYYDRGGYQQESAVKLRRSSSSYPDLRLESSWMIKENDSNKIRFTDDTDVENYGFSRSESLRSESRSFRKIDYNDENQSESKTIEVDPTFVSNNKQEEVLDESKDNVSPTSLSSSSSQSVIDEIEDKVKVVEEIVRDEVESLVVEDESSKNNHNDDVEVDESNDILSTPKQQSYIPPPSPPTPMNILPPPSPNSYFWPPPSPPPPPPPPPPSRRTQLLKPEKETGQTFETIGYGRYRWNDNGDSNSVVREPRSKAQPPKTALTQRLKPVVVASRQNEFSRGASVKKTRGVNVVTKEFFTSFYQQTKRKRKPIGKRRSYENLEDFIEHSPKTTIHRSMSTPEFPPSSPPPPPPPPPPPHSVFHTLFSKKGKTKKKVHSIPTPSTTTTKPAAAPPPPPPPPPPFKVKPWKFTIQGDYAKIESNNNSPRSGYSASEDESVSPNSAKTNQIPKSPLFCQSPDVNMKADDFIAKFRAKLTLEKSDSINLNQGYNGPSRLRPDLGH